MKKITIVLLILTFNLSTKSQNLSITETIEYVNNSLIKDGEIEINNSGILTYTTLTKDYDLDVFNYYTSELWNYSKDKQKMETKKSTFLIHLSDIKDIDLFDPNAKKNQYNISYGNAPKEWTIRIKCSTDEVYHIKKGDCISVLKDSYDGSKEYYSSQITIRTKNGHKSSSEKIRNALLYLMDIVKDKSYFTKENDDDLFAANNFNKNKSEISSLNEKGTVKLISKNGVYHIDVTIGNVSIKFILDSGASDVLISKEFEITLIEK